MRRLLNGLESNPIGFSMDGAQQMLERLYQSRLEDLREIAIENEVSKAGNVESLRARLIAELVLSEHDLSWEGIQNSANEDLGGYLGVFGVKKTGTVKARRRRLWLHLNHDPKQLTIDSLNDRTRDDLHALCQHLELPRSGTKTALLSRVAGVLVNQEKSWGKIKKSLKRGTLAAKIPSAKPKPSPKTTSAIPVAEPITDYSPPEIGEPMPESIALPTTAQRTNVEELMTAEQIQRMRDQVENFVSAHSGAWSFEDEAVLRADLLAAGIPINHPRVSAAMAEWLSEATDQDIATADATVPSTSSFDVGAEQALLEMEARNAELESAIREFLLIGQPDDADDLEAFFSSLSSQGFAVELGAVRQTVNDKLNEIKARIEKEQEAVHLGPDSWREREALRKLEMVRQDLLDGLEAILDVCAGDMVQGRLEFEKLARQNGMDMRLPAVSGRLHGLFDLQVSLNESAALNDPRIARRERVVRILQHGAIHLSDSARIALDRLERNIEGFEQVVEAILRKSNSQYGTGEQALLVRFLEQRGYSVNTAELRPRIVACGGVVGVELGYISPKDVPPMPSGINLTETEVDAVVAELRSVISQFDRPEREEDYDIEAEEEIRLGEAVISASNTLDRVKGNLDRADELLGRLNLTE